MEGRALGKEAVLALWAQEVLLRVSPEATGPSGIVALSSRKGIPGLSREQEGQRGRKREPPGGS